MATELALELLAAILALGAVYTHWRRRATLRLFRYFTVLSNLFFALTALCWAGASLTGGASLPILLLRFVGTVSVTVTMLTTAVFLLPQYGLKVLYTGPDLFLHLICPLLALIALFLGEKFEAPTLFALLGVVPMLLYAAVYVRNVVVLKRWEDFYGFNKRGLWMLSFVVMTLFNALLSLALYALA